MLFPLNPEDKIKNWYAGEVIKENGVIKIPDNIMADKVSIYLGLWDPWVTKKRCPVMKSSGELSNDSVKVVEIMIR